MCTDIWTKSLIRWKFLQKKSLGPNAVQTTSMLAREHQLTTLRAKAIGLDTDSDLFLDEPLVLDKSCNTGLKGHGPYNTQGLRMFSGDGDDRPADGPPGLLLHHLDDQLGFRTKREWAGKWRGKFLHTTRFVARSCSEVGRQVDRGTQGVD